MVKLPTWDELPEAPGGARSAWGLFGAEDSVGMVNLQDPEAVVAAAQLVRRGRVFPLNASLSAFSPALASFRGTPRHTLLTRPHGGFDDVYDNLFPQASSQWDALAHVPARPGAFYNGATPDDIAAGARNTIDHWSRRGIVGRGVLVDLARWRAATGAPYDPGAAVAFGPEDLDAALAWTDVQPAQGDVLVLRTGFLAWYAQQPADVRAELPRTLTAPGLDHSEAVARWLWDRHPAAVASDTFAVEVWPPDWRPEAEPFGFLHRVLIGHLGLALGELWWLEELASDCAEDQRYEFLLASAPLHVPGGIGSPANALAIK